MTVVTPGCGPLFSERTTSAEAVAELAEMRICDGLPVVPPTVALLEAMLAGLDRPDEPLGPVPPLFTELTAANAAYYCVLAGARAEHLPLVLTAVQSCLAPEFNLLGVQTTTGSAAVGVAVHGPVADELGLSAGPGCLGGAPYANSVVGRAVALALRGIGGASSGRIDMSTMGQPGKLGLCFAHDDTSPLSSFGTGSSHVTAFAFSGTTEVLPLGGGGQVHDVVVPLAECIATSWLAMGEPLRHVSNDDIIVLTPEIATQLVNLGLNRDDFAGQVSELARTLVIERAARHDLVGDVGAAAGHAPADLLVLVAGGPGIKMTYLPTWRGGSRSVTRMVG